jgi:hypothetical protein
MATLSVALQLQCCNCSPVPSALKQDDPSCNFLFLIEAPTLTCHLAILVTICNRMTHVWQKSPLLLVSSLAQVQQRPATCSIQASVPYKTGVVLPLQPQLAARNALSRFRVALSMLLGAPMQVIVWLLSRNTLPYVYLLRCQRSQ